MDLWTRLATDPIAVYGAELSTGLAIIRVLEWLQNPPRVAVQWSLSQFPSNAPGLTHPAIAFWAYNFGLRPTTLTSFFYIVPRKKIGVSGKVTVIESPNPGTNREDVPPIPARLGPGGMVTVYWVLEDFNRSEISS